MKKVLTLAATILTGAAITAAAATPSKLPGFQDMTDHWASASVQQAVVKGYVDGYEDGSFKPDEQVTRAEFIKMAITALNEAVDGPDGGTWYSPYLQSAVNAAILTWSDFNYGDWNTLITREQMAKIAVRAIGQKAEDEKQWLYLATKSGLITGLGGGELGPDQATTRAQSVTIIERILNIRAGGKEEVDKYAQSRAEVYWHKTNLETMLDGVYIDVATTPEEDRFKPELLTAEAGDGNYRGWVEGYYVIDLDDPHDPYRYLIDERTYMYDFEKDKDVSLPRSAYMLVSMNCFELIDNISNLRTVMLPYVSFSTRFENANLIEEGNLMSQTGVSFQTESGALESTEAGYVREGGKFVKYRKGYLFPKAIIHAKQNDSLNVIYHRFADWGQYPIQDIAKYKLVENRRPQ